MILFEEMKIQESLVWSKYHYDLTDFYQSDANLNYSTLQETKVSAFHVPVFYFII